MPSIAIECENLEQNPHCPHGPTLKFTRTTNGRKVTYFACSACRDRKLCPFYLEVTKETTLGQRITLNSWKKNTLSSINSKNLYEKFRQICILSPADRAYCHTCNIFLIPEEIEHHSQHHLKRTITNEELTHPTKIILPLTEDKREAQYWFTSQTIEVLISSLRFCRTESVLCIGAPSVNEVLRDRCNKTLLLDIDHRYLNFYTENEFCWFNMFNFFFMNNPTLCKKALREAMKFESVTVIIDPPFGARLEPLSKTVDTLNQLYKEERNDPKAELKVFLAMPYFMEPNIVSSFPNFKVLNYVVTYINQSKFKDGVTKVSRSPVRFFTNVDLSLIPLPKSEGYSLCKKCKRWVGSNARHCDLCNNCPPCHQETFQHCSLCSKCVKKSWKHCKKCNKCGHKNHLCLQFKDHIGNVHQM